MTTLTMQFRSSDKGVFAAVIGDDENTLLAVERENAESAASDLVKMYFLLNPLSEAASERKPKDGNSLAIYSGPRIRAALRKAIDDRSTVRIKSYVRADGERSEDRYYDPTSMSMSGGVVYGYDHLKQRTTSFRLDGIGSIEVVS